MARRIAADADTDVFRAVITKKYQHSLMPVTIYEGPYTSEATAKARVSFWKRRLASKDGSSWATGHVESGRVTWTARPE